jgi:carbonic anhydrase/acetyltransferase-like protein (isoleucine patch superfamily)
MNVVIRGDVNHIQIGRRSNVQDGTIVHVMHDASDVIGNEVTTGMARRSECTVEDRVLIAWGFLNGARVGGPIAAVDRLCPSASRFRRVRSSGSPARVRRTLSDAEVASILEYAGNYVRPLVRP